MNETKAIKSKVEGMKPLKNGWFLSKSILLVGLFWLQSFHQLQASAVFYVSSIGQSQNKNIYGATIDLNGDVTSWGSNYKDIAFKLVASNSGTFLDSSAVWVSANKGNNADSSNNLLRATWFAGPITSNPTYSSRLGTASLNSTLLTSSFADFMIGPSAFDNPVAISNNASGSDFYIRIWATGGNSNAGFGIKVLDNATLEYASPDTSITMYNWDGTTYSSAPATTNISLVPEPSALSLLAVGLGGLAILRRRRS